MINFFAVLNADLECGELCGLYMLIVDLGCGELCGLYMLIYIYDLECGELCGLHMLIVAALDVRGYVHFHGAVSPTFPYRTYYGAVHPVSSRQSINLSVHHSHH